MYKFAIMQPFSYYRRSFPTCIACTTLKRLYLEMQPASGNDILELQPENIHLMLKEEESLEF